VVTQFHEKEDAMKWAKLSDGELQGLHELEANIGATVLAYEPVGAVADLNETDLQSLQDMEADTGYILLALKAD
jgi:hypothetical protein